MTSDTATLIARCAELQADNARLRMERADAAEDRVGQQMGQARERAGLLELIRNLDERRDTMAEQIRHEQEHDVALEDRRAMQPLAYQTVEIMAREVAQARLEAQAAGARVLELQAELERVTGRITQE